MMQTKIITGNIETSECACSLDDAINKAIRELEEDGHRVRDVSIPHHIPRIDEKGFPCPGVGIAVIFYDDSALKGDNSEDIADLYHRGGGTVRTRRSAEEERRMAEIISKFV